MTSASRPVFCAQPKEAQTAAGSAGATLRAPRVRLRGGFTANKMVGAVGIEPTTSPM